MSTNSYFFHPNGGGIKQGFLMENEAGAPVYEAKVLKMPLFGAATVEFIDHTTGRSEEHKIGHTATIEHENGGIFDAFSTKSYYKYDGVKIWDYLHEKGVVYVTCSGMITTGNAAKEPSENLQLTGS